MSIAAKPEAPLDNDEIIKRWKQNRYYDRGITDEVYARATKEFDRILQLAKLGAVVDKYYFEIVYALESVDKRDVRAKTAREAMANALKKD